MSDEVDILVGRALRRRRRLMGLTQGQVAEAVGVRFQQIQKYECAGNRISVATLWRLACVLEVDVGYFFAGAQRPDDVVAAAEHAAPRTFETYGRAA